MATLIANAVGQLSADQTTTDLTIGGESRTPTGCVVLCTYATALDTTLATDAGLSVGYSDFTDSFVTTANAEDGQATTDTNAESNSALVLALHTAGTATIIRSATVSAISGGIRLTPVEESGTQNQVFAIIIFEAECKALNTTDTAISADAEFDFAHGLSGEPNFGWVSYVHSDFGVGGDNARLSLGVFSNESDTIVQKSMGHTFQHNVADGENHGYLSTSRIMFTTNVSAGTVSISGEITGIDTTNWSITARDSDISSPVVGLLVYAADVTAEVLSVDAPISTSVDWNFDGGSFTASHTTMLMSLLRNEDSAKTDATQAGGYGYYVTDGTTDFSAVMSNENAADPSESDSRLSQDLYLLEHDGTAAFQLNSVAFTSDGWDVANANITSIVTPVRKWLCLSISIPPAGTPKGVLGLPLHGPLGGPI